MVRQAEEEKRKKEEEKREKKRIREEKKRQKEQQKSKTKRKKGVPQKQTPTQQQSTVTTSQQPPLTRGNTAVYLEPCGHCGEMWISGEEWVECHVCLICYHVACVSNGDEVDQMDFACLDCSY